MNGRELFLNDRVQFCGFLFASFHPLEQQFLWPASIVQCQSELLVGSLVFVPSSFVVEVSVVCGFRRCRSGINGNYN